MVDKKIELHSIRLQLQGLPQFSESSIDESTMGAGVQVSKELHPLSSTLAH